jgi:hypothetical protein
MSTRNETISRDLARAARKIAKAIDLCDIDPSGIIQMKVTIPLLNDKDNTVKQVSTFVCTLAEMQDLFEEEEIRFDQVVYEEGNPKPLPGAKGRIFGKKVVAKLLEKEK